MVDLSKDNDIARKTLIIVFIFALIITCFWIVKPFILSFIWASTVVIATWPLLEYLQNKFHGKRTPAVIIMTVTLLLLFTIPFAVFINYLIAHGAEITKWLADPDNLVNLPDMNWLLKIPYVGDELFEIWNDMLADGGKDLFEKIKPYLGRSLAWIVSQMINFGQFMFHAILMIVFSALLYYKGEAAGLAIRHLAVRLTGERGDRIVLLAGQSIQAVALGIVVTAIFQALLCVIALGFAHVPYAILLTAFIFVMCVAQLGPLFILIPVTIWLFYSDSIGWGIFMIVFSIFVSTVDTLIRPLLISKGANLPFLLIMVGAIGGLISLGMIGLFVGPMVLAVASSLFTAWVNEVPAPEITSQPDTRLERENSPRENKRIN